MKRLALALTALSPSLAVAQGDYVMDALAIYEGMSGAATAAVVPIALGLAGMLIIYRLALGSLEGAFREDNAARFLLMEIGIPAGFCLWVIGNSVWLIPQMIDGFETVGGMVSNIARGMLQPDALLNFGIKSARMIFNLFGEDGVFNSVKDIPAGIGIILIALFVMVVFGLASALVFLLRAETWAVMCVFPLMVALALLKQMAWTGWSVANYILNIGFRLILYYFLLGVFIKQAYEFEKLVRAAAKAGDKGATLELIVAFAGLLIVFAILAWSVPKIVHALLSGMGTNQSEAVHGALRSAAGIQEAISNALGGNRQGGGGDAGNAPGGNGQTSVSAASSAPPASGGGGGNSGGAGGGGAGKSSSALGAFASNRGGASVKGNKGK